MPLRFARPIPGRADVTHVHLPESRGFRPTAQVSYLLDVVYAGMSVNTHFPRLRVLESVRCLECGEIYSKPTGGGALARNPGCPQCSYVGWIPISLPPETTTTRPLRGVGGRSEELQEEAAD